MHKGADPLAAFAVVGLTVLLGACVPWIPQKDDIVGTWIERPGVLCGDDVPCARFVFFADGRFVAENVPPEFFFALMRQRRLHKDGTWELKVPGGILVTPELHLHFNPNMVASVRVLWGLRGFIISAWRHGELGEEYFELTKER
jgi:hypothetical protein